jgi:hypothetical protein
VTLPQNFAENTEFIPRRTTALRDSGHWPSECDVINELVIKPIKIGDEDK